ncbi:hypothetical protein CCACVL1_27243 [Corchorus capsularis]|uniref:Uncharacterized protein n=1 Tax=Corchorus capsularis TaxID=210143 RepID=A0A1R3GBI1_COCAP|nr:hypothetical protein CCACVL1_27243 [Corchorus capsularis]
MASVVRTEVRSGGGMSKVGPGPNPTQPGP